MSARQDAARHLLLDLEKMMEGFEPRERWLIALGQAQGLLAARCAVLEERTAYDLITPLLNAAEARRDRECEAFTADPQGRAPVPLAPAQAAESSTTNCPDGR